MKTGFGEKCAAVRQGLGIAQEYMAKLLGLKSSKAFSRFEHDEGRYSDEQYETTARALGFSSALSLQGFDLVKAIARYEAERASGAAIDPHKLLQENDGLKARLAEREADVQRYKGVEQVLLDRIRNCEQGALRP